MTEWLGESLSLNDNDEFGKFIFFPFRVKQKHVSRDGRIRSVGVKM